jgi:predicted pyridoxine 5'-phosphate oxidase superfamily flavin-nucleotide-binding protein
MALATRPKRTVHHKKRSGKHHRHSKPYLKAYWPYLPMLLIVAVGIMVNAIWSSNAVLGAHQDFSATSLLSATNQQRRNDAEPALTIDPQLSAAAQAKANDMVSHRANILNADYRAVGFGVAQAADFQGKGAQTVVVAEYAEPASSAAHITFTVDNPAHVAGAETKNTELAARPVARVQLLTNGQAAWSLAAVSALTGAAISVFVVRHGFRLKRALNHGEAFIAHHPYVDVGIVLVITIGVVLTRTSGIIR